MNRYDKSEALRYDEQLIRLVVPVWQIREESIRDRLDGALVVCAYAFTVLDTLFQLVRTSFMLPKS